MKTGFVDVVGFGGMYLIDEAGQIFTRYRMRIMKQSLSHDGYMVVGLSKDGGRKQYRVHRLVAEAFIRKEDGKDFINHIDGEKTNNHVSNLEWCTVQENCLHSIHILGNTVTKGGLPPKAVVSVDLSNGEIAVFASSMDAERKIGIHHGAVTRVCKGKQRSHKGYKWFYTSEFNSKECSPCSFH